MPNLQQLPTTEQSLNLYLEQRAKLAAMKQEIEKQLDAANAEIKALLLDCDGQRFEGQDFTATLVISTRESLDKTKLLEAGVSTAQIKAATKTSTFDKLDVRKRKASAEG